MRYAIEYSFEGHGVIFVGANNEDEARELAEEQLEDEDEIINHIRNINVYNLETEEVDE